MAQTYSNDFFDSVIDCYHCYTDGNRADVMFPDTDAKVYGMNVIPALVRKAGTVVLAFVLMDNHVHFCLNGHEENCRRFMKLYVFAVANYLTKTFRSGVQRARVQVFGSGDHHERATYEDNSLHIQKSVGGWI